MPMVIGGPAPRHSPPASRGDSRPGDDLIRRLPNTGAWGTLEADKGALVASNGRSRRLPAPVRRIRPRRTRSCRPLISRATGPEPYALFCTSLIRGDSPLRLPGTLSHCQTPFIRGARGRMPCSASSRGLRSQPGIGQFDGSLGAQSQPEPGRQGSRVQSRLAGRRHPHCRA